MFVRYVAGVLLFTSHATAMLLRSSSNDTGARTGLPVEAGAWKLNLNIAREKPNDDERSG